jgi:hypothetical protein
MSFIEPIVPNPDWGLPGIGVPYEDEDDDE